MSIKKAFQMALILTVFFTMGAAPALSDPTDSENEIGSMADGDQDGMPDGWEVTHGLDPNNSGDALVDNDQDGIVNLDEYQNGSNPGAKDYFSISGSVSFSGDQTGQLYIAAYTVTDNNFETPIGEQVHEWGTGMESTEFSLSVPNGSYVPRAFLDTDYDGQADDGEPQGVYDDEPIVINDSDDGTARNFMIGGDNPATPAGVKIYAEDADANDWFGGEVAIDRNYAIVGAPEYADTEGKGAAYIFERQGETWIQLAKLTAGDGVAQDRFGISVDICGDTAIVSNSHAHPVDSEYTKYSGAAYIFVKPSDGWRDMNETAKLTFRDEAMSEPLRNQTFAYIEHSVALTEKYAVVGVDYEIEGNDLAGAVYVYEKPVNGWTTTSETLRLMADTPQNGARFGKSVDVSGEYIIVGAPLFNGVQRDTGAVYIFKRESSIWTLDQKFVYDHAEKFDYFGGNVSMDGNYAAIGSYNAGIENIGKAFVYELQNATWEKVATLSPDDGVLGDRFSKSGIVISDDYVFACSHYVDSSTGAVYGFRKPADGWKDMTQSMKIVPDDAKMGYRFGISVDYTDGHLISGASRDDDKATDAGAAYIYPLTNGIDLQRGLVAHYPFNDDFQDAIGDAHGEPVGQPVLAEGPCETGQVLQVDEGSYLRIPAEKRFIPGDDSFSIALWYKVDNIEDIPLSRLFTIQGGDFREGVALWVCTRFTGYPRVRLMVDDGEGASGNQKIESPEVSLEEWTHVVGVLNRGNSTLSMYVNGNKVAEQTLRETSSIDPTMDMLIGAYDYGSNIVSDRIGIDELRIYNRALSGAEIQELANSDNQCTPGGSQNIVTIQPHSDVVEAGRSFQAKINIEGSNIWAADIRCNVDPKVLDLYDKGRYGFVMPTRFRFEIPIESDPAIGSWGAALSLKQPIEPLDGAGTFARNIRFRPLEGVYGEVTITGNATLTDPMGNILPVTVIDGTVFIDDGIHGGDNVIEGTVKYTDGTPAAGIDVTISLGGKEYTVQTDENGHYSFDELRDPVDGQTYTVKATDGDFSVEATVDSVEDSPVTVPLELLNTQLADLNKDGVVDIADFTLLADSYGLSEGDDGYDPRADIKPDGTINVQDLALLGSHWQG